MRVAQFIRSYVDSSFKAEPEFEDWEVALLLDSIKYYVTGKNDSLINRLLRGGYIFG